jgi:hypothetical protein
MMDFEKRLEKAIQRGQRAGDVAAEEEARRRLNDQELRRLHGQYRLELSEHIETCLKKVPQYIPGFRLEPVVSDRGWGAAISRDDFRVRRGDGLSNYFSRLEMVIRPVSQAFVLEMVAKGTIRNKEVFSRSHYQALSDVDVASFTELIDHWVLEYAELFAARQDA